MKTVARFGLVPCCSLVAIWFLFAAEARVSHAACDDSILKHRIIVRLFPDRHRLEGVDRLNLRRVGGACRRWVFRMNDGLDVERVLVDGEKASVRKTVGDGTEGDEGWADWEIKWGNGGNERAEDITVEITYSGAIYDTLKVPSFSREFIANQTTGLIGEKGIYLGEESRWYPRHAGNLTPFSLEVWIPSEFEVVSQGKRVLDEVNGEDRRVWWESDHPTDVIYLIAGRYEVEEREVDGIRIYAYFFPESRDLRDSYLSATERYIRLYSDLIAPYPYEKFAVVENFFETGYGMPSFTLLGSSVIRLPFIVHTSLGHEVLHNWWGNSVFVDSSSGNWCESLTTYMADYYYKERMGEGAAKEYRMEINKAYSNYVNANNDFSLSAFTSRTTPATRSIGYGKGAMIYHGLRRLMGDEVFHQALKNFFKNHMFRYASWSDLQAAFEEAGKRDLDWYFEQWIEGVGAPLLHLEEVKLNGDPPARVDLTLSQEGSGPPFRLQVPVVVEYGDGEEEHIVELHRERESFSLPVSQAPVALSVDPDYHLFRRMEPLEIPPSLSMVLGDEEEILLLPDRADDSIIAAYGELVGQINRTGKAEAKRTAEVTESEMEESSFLIFGDPGENSAWNRLDAAAEDIFEMGEDSVTVAGKTYPKEGHSFLLAFRSPWGTGNGIATFFGYGTASIQEAGRKLVHYGKYGYLVFEGGKNVAKGTWEVKDSPLTYRFNQFGSRSQ